MSVRIIDKAAEKVVGVRVVGPYPQTIPQGSQQLLAWRKRHGVPFGKWLVLYWDDPAEVAPEKLRADVVISVADDFALPAGSEGVTVRTLPPIHLVCFGTTQLLAVASSMACHLTAFLTMTRAAG